MFCTQVTLHPNHDASLRRVRAEMHGGARPALSVSIEERHDAGRTCVTFYGSPTAVLAEIEEVRAAIDAALARFGPSLPEPVGNAA